MVEEHYFSSLLGFYIRYIVLGDADNTYDFSDIPRLIGPLKQGADLVIGSRFKGEIKPGSMAPLHRYIRNPVLTMMLNFVFHTGFSKSRIISRLSKVVYLLPLAVIPLHEPERTAGCTFFAAFPCAPDRLGGCLISPRYVPVRCRADRRLQHGCRAPVEREVALEDLGVLWFPRGS
jgi:hypothetical protein